MPIDDYTLEKFSGIPGDKVLNFLYATFNGREAFSSQETHMAEDSQLAIEALERYGCYASRERGVTYPVFCQAAYLAEKTMWYAFFIPGITNEGIKYIAGIALFDNHDTNGFYLRFTWWWPGFSPSRNTLNAINDYIESISLPETLPTLLFLEKPRLIGEISDQSFIRSFTVSPTTNFPAPVPIKFELNDNEFPHQISAPLLNPREWETLEELLSPQHTALIPGYSCRKAGDILSSEAERIAKKYSFYLKTEDPKNKSNSVVSHKNHDLYFILKDDLTRCIGIIFFIKPGKNNASWEYFLRTHKNQYEHHKRINPFRLQNNESETDYLKRKIANNTRKHTIASKVNLPKEENIRLYFEGKHPKTVAEKYRRKAHLYQQYLFYSKAKLRLKGNEDKLASLEAIWIHPYHRREDLLTPLIEYFRNQYGIFNISTSNKALEQCLKQNDITCSEICAPTSPYEQTAPSYLIS